MNLRSRSLQKELLDDAEIVTADLFTNLKELHVINKLLGGYKASRRGLAKILNRNRFLETIVDVGFGGGDFIRELSREARNKGRDLFCYGVDLKQDCVDFAEMNLRGFRNKKLIRADYRDMPAEVLTETELMHCSLFLHHLSDEQILSLLSFSRSKGWIFLANDLHRNFFAYYSIRLLTWLFSGSYLVRNDAPLSVARGFKKRELVSLLERSGYKNYSVRWSWAFRYTIIAWD